MVSGYNGFRNKFGADHLLFAETGEHFVLHNGVIPAGGGFFESTKDPEIDGAVIRTAAKHRETWVIFLCQRLQNEAENAADLRSRDGP